MRYWLYVLALLFLSHTAVDTAYAQSEPAPPPYQIERSASYTLKDDTSQRHYEVYVKTPPGYDQPENAQRRYPVVYLNDGPYTFQVASGVSRVPFSQRLFEEFIIVGIGYASENTPADSRGRDYTPSVDARKPYVTGGARAYLDFLKGRVLPHVENIYRIDPARRTLSGQSYGGLFGLWVAFNEPALFQNYILTSTSLWYGKRMLFQAERDYARQHRDLKANIFFAVGGNERPGKCGGSDCADMVGDQQAMAKQLQARKYPGLALHTRVVDGAFHETTFPTGLLWAMQSLFMPAK